MIDLLGKRVSLDPAPTRVVAPAMSAVAIGHCPGPVRPERLSMTCREQLEQLGFGDAANRITAGNFAADAPQKDTTSMAWRARTLQHLPLMFENFAQLTDCFPAAEIAATGHGGPLTGRQAWLPSVAADFFRSGGRRLWVVVVDEDRDNAFLPSGANVATVPVDELTGVDLVAHLADASLLLVPDLERLCVPQGLLDVPPLQLPEPRPAFEPCPVGAAVRPEIATDVKPLAPLQADDARFGGAVVELLRFLQRWRPDMQLLVGAPLQFDRQLERPGLHRAAWQEVLALPGTLLRHLQPLYPCLREGDGGLRTAAGLVAGAICDVAERGTPWRSIAGRPIATAARPYPPVRPLDVARLREDLDLGVLVPVPTGVALDDERTPQPKTSDGIDFAGAAEVVRLLGWLRQRLTELGNRIVFDVDVGDPRPALALRQFLLRLYAAGALRGNTPEEAFSLRADSTGDGRMQFTIAIAPAYPIDRIVLTFVADRGRSAVEVRDG